MPDLDALRALLTDLAGEDAAALVAETRADGRAAAAAVLRDLWRDAYIDAAGRPERGTALWVYCVVDAGAELALERNGVDGEPLTIITAGSLAAVVGAVGLRDFADEPLRANLEDLAWVDRVARAHEAVQAAVMAQTAIVPLRLCTICLTENRVRTLLEESAENLRAALKALRGRAEWGVKLFGPAATAVAATREAETGAAYLQQRRDAHAVREEAQRGAAERARGVHDAVAALAVEARTNQPQAREAHGRDAEMLLNGVYLVADERRGELADMVAGLAAEYAETGYALELTGPWPAYNFAGGLA